MAMHIWKNPQGYIAVKGRIPSVANPPQVYRMSDSEVAGIAGRATVAMVALAGYARLCAATPDLRSEQAYQPASIHIWISRRLGDESCCRFSSRILYSRQNSK